MKFDPFNNRLCRDIRNQLSAGFLKAIRAKDFRLSGEVWQSLLENGVKPYQQEYIRGRLRRYEEVFKRLEGQIVDDPYVIASYLWDEELFYEVHEYLEYHWKNATGNNKAILQAMIRAAGTYVHLEQGNLVGAAKMAEKAVAVLEANPESVPACLDLQPLLAKLRDLDPVPPKLNRCL